MEETNAPDEVTRLQQRIDMLEEANSAWQNENYWIRSSLEDILSTAQEHDWPKGVLVMVGNILRGMSEPMER